MKNFLCQKSVFGYVYSVVSMILLGVCWHFEAFAEEEMKPYLIPTEFIDSDNQTILETSRSLTAHLASEKDKAIAIHDFVRDHVKFGFSRNFWKQKASEVLQEGKGFCNTKATLFIALLRASNVPAKQVFVNINSQILTGFFDRISAFVDHSYVSVFLDGRWINTDSFIVDSQLFESSQALLSKQRRKLGYGTVLGATHKWNGASDSFSQFLPALVDNLTTSSASDYTDVGDFYSRSPDAINGSWIGRLLFVFFASSANNRIQKLRESPSGP
jgi:Transglutaminase-like superfamily